MHLLCVGSVLVKCVLVDTDAAVAILKQPRGTHLSTDIDLIIRLCKGDTINDLLSEKTNEGM